MKSAFKPWAPGISFTQLIKIIDKHHEKELNKSDKFRFLIVEGKLTYYKVKNVIQV